MWKILLTTFGIVFLAELGDKTQLATMMMATKSNSILAVFIGASLALVLSSFVGVVLGSFITRNIPSYYLHNGAGIGFILIGLLFLFHKI